MSTDRWGAPVLCLVMAGVLFAAFAANGKAGPGLGAAAVVLGYGAVLAVGGRSQTVRLMRGQKDDERLATVELRAQSFSGQVLVLVLLAGFVQSVARDIDPAPYGWLCAVAGVTYLVGLGWYRFRG